MNFVATSTSHTIIFAGELDARTTNVSYFIDNAVLLVNGVPTTPAPSAWLLTSAGLGFVAAFQMRERFFAMIRNR